MAKYKNCIINKRQLNSLLLILITLIFIGLSGCERYLPVDEAVNLLGTPSIKVTGRGEVATRPDLAIVLLGVQTEAQDATTAMNRNTQKMQTLLTALQNIDIAAEDIQTQNIQLFPHYQEQPPAPLRPGEPPHPTEQPVIRYTAVNLVEVHVREVDRLGTVLDTALRSGSDRIDNLYFRVSNPTESEKQARQAAWENALQKAEQLAALANTKLGRVLSIRENGFTPPPSFRLEGKGGGLNGNQIPTEPGTQSLGTSLEVIWSLIR